MILANIKRPKGANKRNKRVGCGPGSGHGKTACRGEKGQLSRSGNRRKPGFEGGQMPYIRRIPKRGFTNKFRKEFEIVNVGSLGIFDKDTTITPEILKDRGLIKRGLPVKILGDGNLTKSFVVKAHKFAKNAVTKITSAGGKIEIIQ